MDEARYKSIFLVETAEHLQVMYDVLLRLKQKPDTRADIDALFRQVHSVRGMAETMDYQGAARLAHHLEDALERCRKRGSVTARDIDQLLLATELLESLLEDIRQDQPEPEVSLFIQTTFRDQIVIPEAIDRPALFPQSLNGNDQREGKPGSIRVGLDQLDDLINLTDDLLVSRDLLREALVEKSLRQLEVEMERMSMLLDDLQDQVLQARMIELQPLFGRVSIMVDKLARKSDKQIIFECDGSESELDRTLVEQLVDPLMHMIRNAVDHGIKDQGIIQLKVWRDEDKILVRVADNGVGIDPEDIRTTALKHGLLRQEQAATLDDDQLYRLIFQPGFSTAAEMTGISGRGVGMNVVKTAVESLGGEVRIESGIGKGTRITLVLPCGKKRLRRA